MRVDDKSFISPNYKDRQSGIDMVVIHSTHMNAKESLERLCDKESGVSCHYVIDLAGNIFQLVPEEHVAYHAGVSYWRGRDKLNEYSIGIELVDTTDRGLRIEEFPEEQIKSLLKILEKITNKYSIPEFNIIAHSDIAPDRKDDPGEYFPWHILAEQGFGIFPEHEYEHKDLDGFLIQIQDEGDSVSRVQALLKEFGYKISVDSVFGDKTKDVIIAFKRHFDQRAINDVFDEISLAILEELCSKVHSSLA